MSHSLAPCPASALPTLPSPTDFGAYARAVAALPMLDEAEEACLAKAWHEHQDKQAAWRLVLAHLRLVVRVVRDHAGYGLSPGDLAQEGTVGLMKAVHRFDPGRGVRLGAYAVRWIEAEVREYIVHNWRMVRLGSTSAMRKLFFGYRQTVAALRGWGEERDVAPTAAAIAQAMDLTPAQVNQAEAFFRGQDMTLTGPGDAETSQTGPQDWLAGGDPTPEEALTQTDWEQARHHALEQALAALPEREQTIFRERRLREPAVGLVELGQRYAISAERVRQIEARTLQKVSAQLQPLALAAD